MASEEWEADSTSDDLESVNAKLAAGTNGEPVPVEEAQTRVISAFED